jgi:hypothetical protein
MLIATAYFVAPDLADQVSVGVSVEIAWDEPALVPPGDSGSGGAPIAGLFKTISKQATAGKMKRDMMSPLKQL